MNKRNEGREEMDEKMNQKIEARPSLICESEKKGKEKRKRKEGREEQKKRRQEGRKERIVRLPKSSIILFFLLSLLPSFLFPLFPPTLPPNLPLLVAPYPRMI